jgi:hypothetical protein
MISAITSSNHGKTTLYLHIRDITKEDQEQSKSSFLTESYFSIFGEWTTKDLTGVSHPRDLPHDPEYRVHSQVNNV